LNGRKLEYGIWLDLESDVLRAKGKEYIRNLCYIYAYHFTMAGYFVGIYCNRDWYLNVIHDDLKNDFDFWIARYPAGDNGSYNPASTLKPSNSYAVAWQYSSKGSVPGIPTKCDLDVDYDGITKLDYKTSYKKDIDKIAHEVLEGKWGTKNTVPTRKERLEAAGYDYAEVQAKVNELLSGN
jgi:GH25 family lysozyme M1 (1,4-beta-N-acetylmuramidase)